MLRTITLAASLSSGSGGLSGTFTVPEKDYVVLNGTVSLSDATGVVVDADSRDVISTTILYSSTPQELTTDAVPELFAVERILTADNFPHVVLKMGTVISAKFAHIPATSGGAKLVGSIRASVVLSVVALEDYDDVVMKKQNISR